MTFPLIPTPVHQIQTTSLITWYFPCTRFFFFLGNLYTLQWWVWMGIRSWFCNRILIFMRFLGKPARFTKLVTFSLVSANSEFQCGPGLSKLSQLPIALSNAVHHSTTITVFPGTYQTYKCLSKFSFEYISHEEHLIFQFFFNRD